MSAERKKVEKKPLVKAEPKKRVEPTPVVKTVAKKRPEPAPVVEEPKEKRTKAEFKYIRIALDAKAEERNEMTQKVKNGEVKLAYYATDGDKGYHYYQVLNK